MVLRAMRCLSRCQRGELTGEAVQKCAGCRWGVGEPLPGPAGRAELQPARGGWSCCACPPPCSWSVQGVESRRALEASPEPFHVMGASCAAGPLFFPPRFLGHGRPSLSCRHKWLQWGSCQTLRGMIYDAPLAHFELWLLLLFSRI